jgi:parallel beta-helix repeat protein
MTRPLCALTLIAVAIAVGASPAAAESVGCGYVVTQDFKLENDLVDCPGNGLVVGADGITLDLNGHTVAGRFEGDNCSTACLGQNGVDNSRGFDRVKVVNGTIRSFDHAVHLVDSTGNMLQKLAIEASGPIAYPRVGIFLSRSHLNRIDSNSIHRGGPAVLLSGSGRNSLTDNTLDASISFHGGDALQLLDGSDRNFVAGNQLDADGGGVIIRRSSRNVLVKNVGDTKLGNSLTDAQANVIAENVFEAGLGDGLSLSNSSRNVIRGNTVSADGPVWGIRVAGHLNLIDDNTVQDAYRGGIGVLGVLNAVRDNDVSDAGIQGDAILIEAGSWGTLVMGNFASDASDDGIDVDSPATLIGRNTAVGNGDLGIEAVRGVLDARGNRASGNGNPLQCTNVSCAPAG